MRDERGSIPMAVLIFIGLIVVIVIGMAWCGDALFEDEDETNDLGLTELVSGDYDHEEDQRNKNGSDDCAHARAQCSDDDFSPSPSFDKSPVEDSFNPQVCVMPGSCTGGEEET